ncbi:uncharacterized protein [Procambarus clarkii]|uniref:uncharacterized protein n=1 Tax=Procambarus clarkii TaxID=6728 RepID=UPI0037431C50
MDVDAFGPAVETDEEATDFDAASHVETVMNTSTPTSWVDDILCKLAENFEASTEGAVDETPSFCKSDLVTVGQVLEDSRHNVLKLFSLKKSSRQDLPAPAIKLHQTWIYLVDSDSDSDVYSGLQGKFLRRCTNCKQCVHVRSNVCKFCQCDFRNSRELMKKEEEARFLLKGKKALERNTASRVLRRIENQHAQGSLMQINLH